MIENIQERHSLVTFIMQMRMVMPLDFGASATDKHKA